ncbi:glycosyltransferase [Streptomyces sp. ISL-90]|nr:glycosyltransferase [Streptomyces sp. ISL-90]
MSKTIEGPSGPERIKSVAIIGTRGYPSYYGGFETAVRRLAPYLVERGWRVVVYGRPGTTKDHDGGRHPEVDTVVTPGLETKALSTLSFGLTASLHAASWKPDVALVMNHANGYWLPILRARGIPSLVNVDGLEWEREKWGTVAKGVFRTGARFTARWGTRLVYDAQAIADRWEQDFERFGDVIPYGGDPSSPLPVPEGLESGQYVLVVARFVPENTISEFLEAAEGLAKRWPVVIVGSSGYGGEIEERVEELARTNERVKWLGHVSDDHRLFALWQHAGVYFHGHSVGGTNPALVQAMALGAPIVARDTVFNREVLATAGEFALPHPTAIESAIERLMEDQPRRQKLSEAAKSRAAEHYSWDSVCDGYEQSLLGLIGSVSEETRPVAASVGS